MSDSAVLRARLRNALAAERAFGIDALPIDVASLKSRAAAEPTAARAKPASTPPPARSKVPAVKTPTDLFGNPVKVAMAEPQPDAFDGPPLPRDKRISLLVKLDETEVKGCTKCGLHENRTHTVFGEGDPEADLMFIGEGPGENEDLTGRPFVGKAGQKLDEMIKAMKLRREDVYIANIVKCRPPGNRAPTAVETATCTPYLHRQVELVRPKVIVTLGLPATKHVLGLNQPMGKLRGNWHAWRGVKVMPTYHPAYLLRSYTMANRKAVWSDLQQALAALADEGDAVGMDAPS